MTFKDLSVTFPCLPVPDPLPKLHKKNIQIPTYPVPYTCDYGCCIILWALSPVQKPDPSCLQFVIYTLNAIIAHHLANKSSGYVRSGLVYVTILRVTKVAECGKSEYY